jgi:hypothetical protein
MVVPKYVSAQELQQMFNDGKYQEKVASGELTAMVVKSRHPSPRPAFLPFCTQSQLLVYRDLFGEKIAEVHRYLKPDNTLGASRKPDPKMLLHEGVLYAVRPT